MFGYIRPLQGELKVRELERFKACYCGLCHALGKGYGPAARFILNYELVFLAMLLWERDEPVSVKRRRCIAGPCRRKFFCECGKTLEMCAGYSVILAWWKLRDTIADESFVKAAPHRFVSLVLSGAYKKASRRFPEFDGRVRAEIKALAEYESQGECSLDGAADKFAQILAAAAPGSLPENKRRTLLELLYHTGRWIYILDAFDDYKSDAEAGRFNPVAARFSGDGDSLAADSLDRVRTTLAHSNNLLCSSFELLPENEWADTVRNIIYLGMPDVCARVLDGEGLDSVKCRG